MNVFSPAQCLGYVAFGLGVAAFLQKSDRRLKLLNAGELFVYTVHFALLGNPPAATSALVSGVRSVLATYSRSPLLAVLAVVINLAIGAAVVTHPAGWLPVVGSCGATLAAFLLQGIPMRLVFLSSTCCWLVNNILSLSIGGMALEGTLAVVNGWTILRMASARAKIRPPVEEPAGAPPG